MTLGGQQYDFSASSLPQIHQKKKKTTKKKSLIFFYPTRCSYAVCAANRHQNTDVQPAK